jgi:hypothetical protein
MIVLIHWLERFNLFNDEKAATTHVSETTPVC